MERPNQVWCSYITYMGLRGGFVCFTAILDWCSRYVLASDISNTRDGVFCVAALFRALRLGRPESVNTDQGSQFTSASFTGCLEEHGVRISIADLMRRQGKVADAVLMLTAAVGRIPDDAELRIALARTLASSGNNVDQARAGKPISSNSAIRCFLCSVSRDSSPLPGWE